MSQLCINVLPVQILNMSKKFMNVAERDSFDLQVPEVSCM